jgi:translation initiation factor IF-3
MQIRALAVAAIRASEQSLAAENGKQVGVDTTAPAYPYNASFVVGASCLVGLRVTCTSEKFAKDHKHVTVRTIKMEKKTADHLPYSSKFNCSRDFMDEMRQEGHKVARRWLEDWKKKSVKEYPEDAAYWV